MEQLELQQLVLVLVLKPAHNPLPHTWEVGQMIAVLEEEEVVVLLVVIKVELYSREGSTLGRMLENRFLHKNIFFYPILLISFQHLDLFHSYPLYSLHSSNLLLLMILFHLH